jgi:hypothetical protein
LPSKPEKEAPAEIVRLSVAQVRANFRRVLAEKCPVFIERHGCVVGCVIPLERTYHATAGEIVAALATALSVAKRAERAAAAE